MAKYTPVLTSKGYREFKARHSAMATGGAIKEAPDAPASTEAMLIAEQLMLQVPDIEFTIEVDIFGTHRVTVHFKGAEIAIDE